VSGIIIYRSSYGSTKQYANWIHEETQFPLYDQREKDIPWREAERLVIGCPLIANKPSLAGWIQKNWDGMKDKQVYLFTTSGADPATNPVMDWLAQSLPDEIVSHVHCFPLPGRFEFAKLNGMHKAMMRIGAIVLRDEDIKNQIRHPVDGVAREKLAPLLARIRQDAASVE
jgi:menaquinone-dependent protoporphyrinogen IX oxidase